MKVLTVVGARPQFIKAAAVSKTIAEVGGLEEVILHTGQHYDPALSEVFFSELSIPSPRYNLEIGSGTHGVQTGRMLADIERVILEEKPDWLLVYGDTNSTLAGALAAVKLHVPVAHVEAGLRSFNRRMPEEINRVMTDHVSTLLFTPTQTATNNLAREGVHGSQVIEVGDVMFDAILAFQEIKGASNLLSQLNLQPKSYVLATIHRAENTNDPARLTAIVEGLNTVAEQIEVVLPLHPRTRKHLADSHLHSDMIRIIEPVGYLEMLQLESNAMLVATDSGGVQKEAYFHRVPCVTLRDETEWTELVEAGWNLLCPPTEAATVTQAILSRLSTQGDAVQLYGDGNASAQIVRHMLDYGNRQGTEADMQDTKQ